MKYEELDQAIGEATIETFADLVFIDTIKLSSFSEPVQYKQIFQIEFAAPGSGIMLLFVSEQLKRQIVENVFARDVSDIKQNEMDDCLLELMNVLGGNFLSRYFGYFEKQNLSLPRVLFNAKELCDKHLFSEFFFNAEGDYFKIMLHLDVS